MLHIVSYLKTNLLFASFLVIGLGTSIAADLEPAETSTRIEVPLTFPAAGLASIGVYTDQGEMIRSLSYAKPVAAGTENLVWDGTTDLGLPAAPGSYHVHGVWFPEPPKINYLMKIGLSGNPPYITSDDRGSWGGNMAPPMDICTNGKQLLAIFGCVEDNKVTGIQLMDVDGNITHRFSSFFGWDCRFACTMDDKNAYLAIADLGKKRLFIAKYDLDRPPRGRILCDIPAGDHQKPGGLWKGLWTVDVKGIALNNGRLYVPVFMDNMLYIVDSVSGKILGSATVPSPRGVTVHDGKLYLLSGTSLCQIDENGSVSGAPLITGLDDPSNITTDADGNFYISDRGASQQVKVFSPDGKPLREIGVKGGRPRDGIYNPAGMLDPRGLCVAPDGKLWVASDAADFQEITVWTPDGKRDKAFYSTTIGSGAGRLSPDRSEMLAGEGPIGNTPGLTAFKLDWDHGTWEPSWHLDLTPEMSHHDDVFTGFGVSGRLAKPFGHMPYLGFEGGMVQGANGKTYLVGGDFSIWLFDPVTKQPKLASLVYTHRVEKKPDGTYQGDYDQGPDNWLTWSDLNGDGKMSLDEVTFAEKPPLLQNIMRITDGGMQLQPDLSILILAPERGALMPGTNTPQVTWNLYKLTPRQVLPSGVPVYDWNNLTKVVELHPPDYKGGDGGYKDPRSTYLSQFRLFNDQIYVSYTAGQSKAKLHLTGVDGDGWWASRNWRMSPMKFDMKTGAPAWMKLGRRAAGVAKPGEMYYPGWGMAASIDGIDYCADAMSQVWAWTDDGLFLGRLYNDNPSNTIFDANGIYVELVGTFAYKINGKTYVLTGDHGVSVHEVDIPKLTPIDGGTVQLTSGLAAGAQPWDPDGPPPGKKPTYLARSIYDFDRTVDKSVRTITIDGKLDSAEWNGVPKMKLDLDGKTVATIQITFDKTNLYLAYDVQDPNGLKNDGHELPYSPFVSGSYVDFDFGPKWSIPNRPDNAEGDVRVIMARITGTTITDYQMGYWPIKQDLRRYLPATTPLPQDIVSPAQTRHFDDVKPVPGLTFAYQITPQGYTLEAQIPFASLGFNPSRQAEIGFDASVAFSDAAGSVRERATHWAGESEARVVDRPGSAELKPQTWGTLQFDRTPLPPVENTATQ